MMTHANTVGINKDQIKQNGLQAQKAYPLGYSPLKEHPALFCKAADRPQLYKRLQKQPWKNWYETILRPYAEVALAAENLAVLQTPLFALKVFPLEGTKIRPIQEMFCWQSAIANCALVGFLEDDTKVVDHARKLLLEAVDANWGLGGWGGEDYEVGSGWDHAWVANSQLITAYDLIANSFTKEERLRWEARIARDLEWCQTDPISPKYNPSWFGSIFMGVAALLLGKNDYVRKVEGMLDQYVDQVLWGEGEYFEGSSYQSGCMEIQNIVLIAALARITGRNPADNKRWAMRAEHWVRRSSPLGTDVTHSDANTISTTAQILLASINELPKEIGSWVVWMYERIGSPEWYHLRGNDAERKEGIDRPTMVGKPKISKPEQRYPYPALYGADPTFWLIVPDPLPQAVEPPFGSYIARNAGLACLRTDWSLQSMHTCLFAPRFYGSPHSHWDSLTFDFWAHGAYLIKNAGYHELFYPAPHVPHHLHKFLNIQPVPTPIKPPAPWNTWTGWNSEKCFRMAPDMHNIPTIDGGGGNHWTSRADPMHFIVNTGWVQSLRVDGGVAASYTNIGKLGTEGKVIRTIIQVEPSENSLGYLVVADDIVPTENPSAKCDWFLHPRGELSGSKSRPRWTTCDYLNSPAKDVHLEVCLPVGDLKYDIKPDGCHAVGGSFQLGSYLDVTWQGARRFWAVLRPASSQHVLPLAEDLPENLGLRIDSRDIILVRKIDESKLVFGEVQTDATTLIAREKGLDFYLAIESTFAELGNGIGFIASKPLMITAKCGRGAVFVDRPHKQPQAMEPVVLTVKNPHIKKGGRVIVDGELKATCLAGGFTVTIETLGMHNWEICE